MSEMLTIDEIKSRFDSEWILVQNPEVDDNLRVLRGIVICHSKNRDEVDLEAVKLRLKSSAFLYTGKMPEGTAIVL